MKTDPPLIIYDAILKLNTLTHLDKIILSKIIMLDNAKGCFVSNPTLAEMIGASIPAISKSINKLIGLNHLELVHFNGRKRFLRCPYTSNLRTYGTLN